MTRNSFFRQQQAPGPVQAGRSRAHEQHQPADPHAPAALCARQARHGRADPWLPRLSRLGDDRPGRRSAVALHGGVRRPRDLGAGCRSDAHGLDRRLRAVPRCRRDGRARRSPFPAFPATPRARCSASRGRRRPSPWRWRCISAACSPGRNGPQTLGEEIKRAQAAGDPDTGETYYRHWLNALERLVSEKGVADAATLARYHDAWDHAADRTPHGAPIELKPDDFRP